MEQYIGLDVSLKETHICVVDGSGAVVARGREVTQPELLSSGDTISNSPELTAHHGFQAFHKTIFT